MSHFSKSVLMLSLMSLYHGRVTFFNVFTTIGYRFSLRLFEDKVEVQDKTSDMSLLLSSK